MPGEWDDHFDVLVVGAGHGGAQVGVGLRQAGFEGSVGLLTEEAELPYERPPLSKEYLLGDKDFDRMLIRKAAFWEERGIDIRTGMKVVEVDPAEKLVRTARGTVSYGKLVWAAGGAARQLGCEGGDLDGVFTIRTRADTDALLAALPDAERVVIVGGGYIGLEAAASLRKLGKDVVLVEALERVLARVAGEELSRFFEAEHRAQGVDLRVSTSVTAIHGEGGKVSAVELAGGEKIAADIVVVGIGMVPEVAPLAAAGAVCENGVRVDAQCRTSLPDIYAIGDCALHENRFAAGQEVRIESVQNATDQANVAAKHIAGQDVAYDATPWFWSNQYDLKLQMVGLSSGFTETVVRGSPEDRSFSVVYLRDGKVIALDCVNAARDFVQGRKLVELGLSPDPAALADAETPLKSLLPT